MKNLLVYVMITNYLYLQMKIRIHFKGLIIKSFFIVLRLEDRSRSLAEISEYSIDDIHDNCNLFSDPESEWAGTLRVDEPEDEDNLHMQATDSRPESDQPNDFQSASVLRTPYRVPAFTYSEYDL